MPDETRRAIVTAGMAGAVAALAPWTGRASGETQAGEDAMAGRRARSSSRASSTCR